MAWLCLIFAGLLEIGWPIGLKMADNSETRISGIVIAVIFMFGSGGIIVVSATYYPDRDRLWCVDRNWCGGSLYCWRAVLSRSVHLLADHWCIINC